MTILDRIVEDTRALVERQKRAVPERALEERAAGMGATRSLERALRQDHLAMLAELKKASPSQGVIRDDFDAPALARQYATHGADAVSILTEPTHFQGSLDHLALARQAIDLPLLRKDFILDPYQLVEARAWGADAVLLIAAVLDRQALYDLHQAAGELGLACLVEVYQHDELDRIDFDQVTILGVNNRDLRTFEVDINHSLRVFSEAPDGVVRVSESGLRTAHDLVYLRRHGVDAVLIGETFMRAPHPGRTLAALRREVETLLRKTNPLLETAPSSTRKPFSFFTPNPSSSNRDTHPDRNPQPLPKNEIKIKICGLTNLEDARFCAGAGADFLGFIQYPPSPRYVAPDVAKEIIAWVYGPEPVGVFVNETTDAVNRVAEAASFAMVQLHGDESPEDCARIERPVIKAFRIPPDVTADQMRRQMEPYREHVAYFLLDTHHPTLWGSTGATFNWHKARDLAVHFPILLAGGLSADNVEDAMRTARPLGVDLSSSLEASPGKKDLDKLVAFFETVDALRAAT